MNNISPISFQGNTKQNTAKGIASRVFCGTECDAFEKAPILEEVNACANKSLKNEIRELYNAIAQEAKDEYKKLINLDFVIPELKFSPEGEDVATYGAFDNIITINEKLLGPKERVIVNGRFLERRDDYPEIYEAVYTPENGPDERSRYLTKEELFAVAVASIKHELTHAFDWQVMLSSGDPKKIFSSIFELLNEDSVRQVRKDLGNQHSSEDIRKAIAHRLWNPENSKFIQNFKPSKLKGSAIDLYYPEHSKFIINNQDIDAKKCPEGYKIEIKIEDFIANELKSAKVIRTPEEYFSRLSEIHAYIEESRFIASDRFEELFPDISLDTIIVLAEATRMKSEKGLDLYIKRRKKAL